MYGMGYGGMSGVCCRPPVAPIAPVGVCGGVAGVGVGCGVGIISIAILILIALAVIF